jgi:hypothetical protein
VAGYFLLWVAQALTILPKVDKGTAPFRSTTSWKPLMSNFFPSFFSASPRSLVISRCPILYPPPPTLAAAEVDNRAEAYEQATLVLRLRRDKLACRSGDGGGG